VTELSWYWIAVGLALPPVAAVLVAVPFWRRKQIILGNIVGTGLVFASAFALIFREYVELDRLTRQCFDAGAVCWPNPSAFTRFAIYAFIGLFEIFGLFLLSLRFEERVRRRDYAPEWR
jgi:hypothetical protein